jgi:putative PIN family toxin of toxin-antitoxin system
MALTAVVDTNILLVSISDRSPYHWVFKSLREGRYDLLVSTEITFEYEEIIRRHLGGDVASDVMKALERFPNVHLVHRYYRWNLIKADPDDNKFVDCALAGAADCIVTYDRHFDVLADSDFPPVRVVTPETFRDVLTETS